MLSYSVLVSFLVFPFGALTQTVYPLSELSWTLDNPGLNISVPASFPSHAHLDLYAEKVIGDPYYGLNDFNLRWVAWSNWTYSAGLKGLDTNSNASKTTYLLFHGLDTFTSIELCGYHVASTNNQFRQYYFDVSDILRKCGNDTEPELSINFGSAPNIVDRIANEPGQETWPVGVNQKYEFPNRWFMRKEQSDFGWDWGPAFAPAGPWQPAHAIQLASSEIHPRNTLVDVYRQGQRNNRIPDQTQPWIVNASIDYLGNLPSDATMLYSIKDLQGDSVANGQLSDLTIVNGAITGSTTIQDESVGLWWPYGLGPQTLYSLEINVQVGNNIVANVTKRIGFRTIVLNEEVISDDQIAMGIAPGNNWHFEINGHEFFAKGSNFIPPDAFWPRVTEERIQNLFEAVIAGNQNMLRVWASGAYSPNFMYDLADEMGILLWSEFEFGDSLYPVDQEFLDNVYEEANYQVRRINHHPSLAFWAGGNELENLELDLLNGTAGEKEYIRYKDEYEKLFLSTIFPAVFENSRSISYAPSSTSNGFISLNFTDAPYFQERYENVEKGSIYGETDYYNYESSVAFDINQYPVGRFSNEFGFHSMPSLQTWQQAISPRDLHFNSTVIQHRNHHYPPGDLNITNLLNSQAGMGEMTMAVQNWYPVPLKPQNSVANFSAWCTATQIFQADYYASQIQFYRRGSGLPQRTLGSLYWQLEDIWQAPTWASIEYDGRWKYLHYRAADVYKNVIVSPFWNKTREEVSVWVTSDLWEDVQGTVDVTWYDWSGQPLEGAQGLTAQPVAVGPLNSTSVYNGSVSTILGSGFDVKDAVVWMSVNVTGRLPNSDVTQFFTHENWWHPATLSDANMVDPGLTLTYDPVSQQFTIEATTGIAAWVWLDYPSGAVVEFTENSFWLLKGIPKTVGFRVKSDTTNGAWLNGVTVQSIWNQTLPY